MISALLINIGGKNTSHTNQLTRKKFSFNFMDAYVNKDCIFGKLLNLVYFSFIFWLQIPIVPYGGATSIEGHTLSPHGGVCIDMSLMKVCTCSIIVVAYLYSFKYDRYNIRYN